MSVTDGSITSDGAELTVRIDGQVLNTGGGTGGSVTGSANVVQTGSTTAVTTLTTATTGNGTTVDWGAARQTVTLFILVNGTVTAGVVDLQASQDGTNWVKIASSAALGTGVNQQITTTSAFRYHRGVVSTTVAGGGSVTATLMAV